jgi:hypothetical protein
MSTPTLNGQLIGQAERVTRALLDRLLADTGITFTQWVALNVTATADPDDLENQVAGGLRIAPAEAGAAIATARGWPHHRGPEPLRGDHRGHRRDQPPPLRGFARRRPDGGRPGARRGDRPGAVRTGHRLTQFGRPLGVVVAQVSGPALETTGRRAGAYSSGEPVSPQSASTWAVC